MTRSTHRSLAALLLCALAAVSGGCASPGGLAAGEPAPPVSTRPRPEPLWRAWVDDSPRSPGREAAAGRTPAAPLPHAPALGPDGLAGVDVAAVVRADRNMAHHATRGRIDAPGKPGLRPPVYLDLTGDGKPELIVAADTESGRTALTVYTARDGGIVPVLFATGRRMAVESLGRDLLIRTAADAGARQAVRYQWDGRRMTVVSEERRYGGCGLGGASGAPSAPGASPGADRGRVGR
ncbi:hypothetical protein ABT144_21535 [Streptomyces sp. NPDC002039]|uniref:hypothetical protein n=1 Tax=unclassified Streptomyces TaxID=2593676 RepID=UPI0033202A82